MGRDFIYRLMLHGCMDAPRWRHINTNNGYWKSIAVAVVLVVAKVVVSICMADVTVREEVDETEEVERESDEVRR